MNLTSDASTLEISESTLYGIARNVIPQTWHRIGFYLRLNYVTLEHLLCDHFHSGIARVVFEMLRIWYGKATQTTAKEALGELYLALKLTNNLTALDVLKSKQSTK